MPAKLYDIKLEGCTTPGGEKYCSVRQQDEEYFFAREALLNDRARTLNQLGEQGLVIPGTGYTTQLIEKVGLITAWPVREVLPQPGWSGPIYARPDGHVLVPDNTPDTAPKPGAGYLRHPARYSCNGSLKALKRHVFDTLGSDRLASFLMALPFAPVIRSLMPRPVPPFAFQLVDETRSSLMRRLCLSVTGSMSSDGLVADPVQKIVADPARYIGNSRDNLLVLGNIAGYLSGSSNRKRRDSVRSLLFDHLLPCDGSDTNATGGPAPCCVIIEAQPVEQLLDLDDAATERLRQCVPTLIAADDQPDADRGDRRWRAIDHHLHDNHGCPLAQFQRRLVEHRAERGLPHIEARLGATFKQYRRDARKYLGDRDVPQQLVDQFALVSAGIDFARRLKVVPTGERENASVKVFKRFVRDRPAPATAASILAEIAARTDVLAVDEQLMSMSEAQLHDVPAFIGNRGRELWVPTQHKDEVFDWRRFRSLRDFDQCFRGKGEKDRLGTKRVIGVWKDARVLRFKLR